MTTRMNLDNLIRPQIGVYMVAAYRRGDFPKREVFANFFYFIIFYLSTKSSITSTEMWSKKITDILPYFTSSTKIWLTKMTDLLANTKCVQIYTLENLDFHRGLNIYTPGILCLISLWNFRSRHPDA